MPVVFVLFNLLVDNVTNTVLFNATAGQWFKNSFLYKVMADALLDHKRNIRTGCRVVADS